MQKGFKAQSAIEFLSTYGFAILVIAIALMLLFMFFSLPKNILPSTCNFYSGFNCADAVYANTSTGSELIIAATDMMPGVVNTSSFSVYLSYVNSTSGYCAPTFAIAGQQIYCVAFFSSKASLGKSYGGIFKVKANYCAAGPSTINNVSCASSSNYTYAGYLTVSASVLPQGGVTGSYYVPITLTNSQSSAVPAQFQQMITFAPSSYSTYEKPNLGNIRFYYGNRELYSWCEANCTSTSAGNVIFWVRLPVAIPPSQAKVIDMYFMPYSTNYDGTYAGEAPQLSPTYAEYDNGAKVFTNYWNFAGTTLPSSWQEPQTAGVTINNGVSFAPGSSIGYIETTAKYPIGAFTETNFDVSTISEGGLVLSTDINGNAYTSDYWIDVGTAAGQAYNGIIADTRSTPNSGSFLSASISSANAFDTSGSFIGSMTATSTEFYIYKNYNTLVGDTTTNIPPQGNYYIFIGGGGGVVFSIN
ncbi:MAG: hypothetical protein QXW10_03230, partial [Candidatus Micrarchaeaceae archaeon]